MEVSKRAFISKGIPLHYSRKSYDEDVHTYFYLPRDDKNPKQSVRITIHARLRMFNCEDLVVGRSTDYSEDFSKLLDMVRNFTKDGCTYSPICIDGSVPKQYRMKVQITTEAYYDSLSDEQLKNFTTYEDANIDTPLKEKIAEAEKKLWNRCVHAGKK